MQFLRKKSRRDNKIQKESEQAASKTDKTIPSVPSCSSFSEDTTENDGAFDYNNLPVL